MTQTGCIYIIKNLVTNKVYVGQTRLKNPMIRWKDHFESAFLKKENYKLYKSMRKHGIENFQFQIIELNIPINVLDDKEKAYIQKYDSLNNGYNETVGGQDDAWHSKLCKEDVIKIIQYIRDGNMTFVEIAHMFGVNPSTISDINNGDTWNFDEIQYPILDKCTKRFFTEDEIQQIYIELKRKMPLVQIAKLHNTSNTTISKINSGYIYRHNNETYPITKQTSMSLFKHLEINQITAIVQELQTTSKNYTQIAEKLNVGRKTIAHINNGKIYLNVLNQLNITQFPIRK